MHKSDTKVSNNSNEEKVDTRWETGVMHNKNHV